MPIRVGTSTSVNCYFGNSGNGSAHVSCREFKNMYFGDMSTLGRENVQPVTVSLSSHLSANIK